MEKFVGSWQVTSTENLEAMLSVLRVDGDMAKSMKESPPVLEYATEGDLWVMRFVSPQGNQEHRFKNGQTINMTGVDGNPVKATITIENNKFVEHYKSDNTVESTVTREVLGDQLLVTIQSQGLTSTARHRKL